MSIGTEEPNPRTTSGPTQEDMTGTNRIPGDEELGCPKEEIGTEALKAEDSKH